MKNIVVLTAVGITYFILALLYMLNTLDAKVILSASSASLCLSCAELIDGIIAGLYMFEDKMIILSIYKVLEWLNNQKKISEDSIKNKRKTLDDDIVIIHDSYEHWRHNLLVLYYGLIFIGILAFFIIMSIASMPINPKYTDTFSLVAFGIMFVSMASKKFFEYFKEVYEDKINRLEEAIQKWEVRMQ